VYKKVDLVITYCNHPRFIFTKTIIAMEEGKYFDKALSSEN